VVYRRRSEGFTVRVERARKRKLKWVLVEPGGGVRAGERGKVKNERKGSGLVPRWNMPYNIVGKGKK